LQHQRRVRRRIERRMSAGKQQAEPLVGERRRLARGALFGEQAQSVAGHRRNLGMPRYINQPPPCCRK
jgi:hypothetical protein